MNSSDANEEQLDWMGSNCWFCGVNPPVSGKSCLVKLKKMTFGAGDSMNVLRSSVAVPRCDTCASHHRRAQSKALLIVFGGALAVFLVVVVWQPIEMEWWVKALLVFAGLVPGATLIGGTFGLPPGQKPESIAEDFIAVQAMKQGGWVKDDQA